MNAKILTRDERQDLCVEKWGSNKGIGTIVASTGFGKTRIAVKSILRMQKKRPDAKIIVTVPTTLLQEQWMENLKEKGCITDHVEVYVINSIIKSKHDCDLLILDEIHKYPADTFSQVFTAVRYRWILGLTATFERLDGRETLLNRFAPVIDRITIEECLANKWVSNYKEYVVVLNVEDLAVYNRITKEFTKHFEYFDYDFALAMSMTGPNGWKAKNAYAQKLCQNATCIQETLKEISIHSAGLMRSIQARKKFIYDHPEKLRIAELIMAMRDDQKIITFSASVAAAERFSNGYVYTGKDSKKAGRITLDEFTKMSKGALHTVKLAEEGLDIPDLSVGIMLGVNSSKIKHAQTRGRVIRYHEGKEAEFFTLILNDTVEVEWWRRSNGRDNVTIIDEENLIKVLEHQPFEEYKEPLRKYTFNY